jgi:serine O-acetyltransferase
MAMQLSLPYSDFKNYVLKQIEHFFPDNQSLEQEEFGKVFDIAIDRTEFCFKHVNLKSYCNEGATFLNHLHANQYAVFLWFLSNTVWVETQNEKFSNKLYCLNRALNSFSCSFETKLPKVFLLLHVVGTVLGRAEFSDFFVAIHGCTVGAHHGKYPKIGRGVALLPHSSVIGDCTIGDRVSIGVNVSIYQKDVPDDTTVFVDNNGLGYKQSTHPWSQHLFNIQL